MANRKQTPDILGDLLDGKRKKPVVEQPSAGDGGAAEPVGIETDDITIIPESHNTIMPENQAVVADKSAKTPRKPAKKSAAASEKPPTAAQKRATAAQTPQDGAEPPLSQNVASEAVSDASPTIADTSTQDGIEVISAQSASRSAVGEKSPGPVDSQPSRSGVENASVVMDATDTAALTAAGNQPVTTTSSQSAQSGAEATGQNVVPGVMKTGVELDALMSEIEAASLAQSGEEVTDIDQPTVAPAAVSGTRTRGKVQPSPDVTPPNKVTATEDRGIMQPVIEIEDRGKVKATYYLSVEAVEALEEAWMELRRLAPNSLRTKVAKSGIVEQALLTALLDLRQNGLLSPLAQRILE